MDGGDGNSGAESKPMAGGAGGVIQIIAPEGEIAADTLSLKHGKNYHQFCCKEAEDGHFLLEGKSRNA